MSINHMNRIMGYFDEKYVSSQNVTQTFDTHMPC